MQFTRIKVATSDDRGNISDVMYKGEFQHAAVIETFVPKDGTPVIRGNHFHAQTEQHIYILDGSLTYWWQWMTITDDGNMVPFGEINSIHVPKGCMVSSPTFEIHALEIWEDCRFIVFSNGLRGGRDYESDTVRIHPPILSLKDIR